MTLSCKEVTATMAQELEQPIYVKPNLIAENGKPGQRIFLVGKLSFKRIA